MYISFSETSLLVTFAPANIWKITPETPEKEHVHYLSVLSDINQIWNMTSFLVNLRHTQFHDSKFSGSEIIPRIVEEGHIDMAKLMSEFCNCQIPSHSYFTTGSLPPISSSW
jgi:hypothetical protein